MSSKKMADAGLLPVNDKARSVLGFSMEAIATHTYVRIGDRTLPVDRTQDVLAPWFKEWWRQANLEANRTNLKGNWICGAFWFRRVAGFGVDMRVR